MRCSLWFLWKICWKCWNFWIFRDKNLQEEQASFCRPSLSKKNSYLWNSPERPALTASSFISGNFERKLFYFPVWFRHSNETTFQDASRGEMKVNPSNCLCLVTRISHNSLDELKWIGCTFMTDLLFSANWVQHGRHRQPTLKCIKMATTQPSSKNIEPNFVVVVAKTHPQHMFRALTGGARSLSIIHH